MSIEKICEAIFDFIVHLNGSSCDFIQKNLCNAYMQMIIAKNSKKCVAKNLFVKINVNNFGIII